jgi:protein CLEC16A
VPCRIAFERGKERHFSFLALSMGASGWLVLAEESPLKQHFGVVRVSAPLAGSNVCITSMFPSILFLFLVAGLPCCLFILSYACAFLCA